MLMLMLISVGIIMSCSGGDSSSRQCLIGDGACVSGTSWALRVCFSKVVSDNRRRGRFHRREVLFVSQKFLGRSGAELVMVDGRTRSEFLKRRKHGGAACGFDHLARTDVEDSILLLLLRLRL